MSAARMIATQGSPAPIVPLHAHLQGMPSIPEMLDWVGQTKTALAKRGRWSTTMILGESFKIDTIEEDLRPELTRLILEYGHDA